MYRLSLLILAMISTLMLGVDASCPWPDICDGEWLSCTYAEFNGDSCPGILTPSEGDVAIREDAPAVSATYDRCETSTTGAETARCIYREGIWREIGALNLGTDVGTNFAMLDSEYQAIIYGKNASAVAHKNASLVSVCTKSSERCSHLLGYNYAGQRIFMLRQNVNGGAYMELLDENGNIGFRLDVDPAATSANFWTHCTKSYATSSSVSADNVGGCTLNNAGAGAAVELDLPAVTRGHHFKVCVEAAQQFTIDPDGTERFLSPATDTNGDYLRNAGTIGDCISFEVIGDGEIRVTGQIGTWTEE